MEFLCHFALTSARIGSKKTRWFDLGLSKDGGIVRVQFGCRSIVVRLGLSVFPAIFSKDAVYQRKHDLLVESKIFGVVCRVIVKGVIGVRVRVGIRIRDVNEWGQVQSSGSLVSKGIASAQELDWKA